MADRETFKDRWRKTWPVLLIGIAYMIPLFWLWSTTGYPESFGFRVKTHGKVGLMENWWYSYHLAQRHRFWDVVTFAYMWAAVAGILAWIAIALWTDWRRNAFSRTPEVDIEKGDAP